MGFHKGRNQMSRLSKYVKEKIVKVLVAALVVGTVAGNGTLTVQAEEAATVVGEESVSGGDAVVKENVVADPEVTRKQRRWLHRKRQQVQVLSCR